MKIEYYAELEQEVKRLGKYDDTTILKLLHEKDIKEIERLNNIINELEKELDRNTELNYYKNNVRQYNKTLTEGAIMYRDYIKEKLQELKGSDKE